MAGDYQDPRWQRLRLEVMQRDEFRCVACRDDASTLHVHHKRYADKLWESSLGDLQTLCESCHFALGKHPKAGIFWIRGQDADGKQFVAIEHCPGCGYGYVNARGDGLYCNGCDWTFPTTFDVVFKTMDYRQGTGDA
jgi:hypothetical protein